MIEARNFEHEASFLCRDVAIDALQADSRHLTILCMDAHLTLQVALIVIVTSVERSRFVVLQEIAVGIVLVACLACITQ